MAAFDWAAIRSDYDRLWNTAKDALAQGHIQPDPIPDAKSTRWGISAILRPSEPVASLLEDTVAHLTTWTGKQQVLYTQASFHTTIRSLEFYRTTIAPDDEQVAQYVRILQHLGRGYFPLRIAYQGLTANQTGIMVQGWPLDDHLYRLRQAFHAQLQESHLLTGPEAQSPRRTAHISLIVFSGPVHNPAALVACIEKHRATVFGEVVTSTLELVRYARTLRDVTLIPLARS